MQLSLNGCTWQSKTMNDVSDFHFHSFICGIEMNYCTVCVLKIHLLSKTRKLVVIYLEYYLYSVDKYAIRIKSL